MSILLLIFEGEKEEKYQKCPELSYCTTMMVFFGITEDYVSIRDSLEVKRVSPFISAFIKGSSWYRERKGREVSWNHFQPGDTADTQGDWKVISFSQSLHQSILCLLSLSVSLSLSLPTTPPSICFSLNLPHFQLAHNFSSPKLGLHVVLDFHGPTHDSLCNQHNLTSYTPFVSGQMFAEKNPIGCQL